MFARIRSILSCGLDAFICDLEAIAEKPLLLREFLTLTAHDYSVNLVGHYPVRLCGLKHAGGVSLGPQSLNEIIVPSTKHLIRLAEDIGVVEEDSLVPGHDVEFPSVVDHPPENLLLNLSGH